jgi:hypothetical protein
MAPRGKSPSEPLAFADCWSWLFALAAAPKFAGEERKIEPNIVPDDDAPAHQLDYARQDVMKQRLPRDHIVRDARQRDNAGPHATLRIDQLLILRHAPPAFNAHDANLDYAVAEIGRCAGRFDVDECEGNFTQLVNQGYGQRWCSVTRN